MHDKLEYGLDQEEVDDLIISIRDAGSELERETFVPLANEITNLASHKTGANINSMSNIA